MVGNSNESVYIVQGQVQIPNQLVYKLFPVPFPLISTRYGNSKSTVQCPPNVQRFPLWKKWPWNVKIKQSRTNWLLVVCHWSQRDQKVSICWGVEDNNFKKFKVSKVSMKQMLKSFVITLREHLPKKCFLSGIARMKGRGGEALARIKKYNIYIYLWRTKKMYKLPERRGGGGGGVIRAMPERKHSFFQEVFP